MSTKPFWPCPNHCEGWCRSITVKEGNVEPMTNHHPRCQYVDSSLIDVWKVSLDGSSYYTDEEHAADAAKENDPEVTVTKEKMHREIYENLPEFIGF